MHISNCLNPSLITNPHSGELLRVRCGKCAACQNAKSKNWINRLLEEYSHHRYAYMVNLTYDDRHLPYLVRQGDNIIFGNRQSDLCIPFDEFQKLIDDSDDPEKELKYFEDRLSDDLHFPCICVKDVQDFNKRLNKFFHDHITFRYSNFRYFCAFEYGPSTYRPHIHCIYYFDEPGIAAYFNEAVFQNWKNGRTSTAHIYSNGGFSYVAQYVNMLTHLPAVYSHKDLRQKHIFSKQPPIGSHSFLASEIRDIYDRLPVKRTVFDSMSGEYITLPANSTFKNRFFPKCEGYNRRSDNDRILLYRLTEIFPAEDFGEFCNAVYSFYCRYRLDGSIEKEIYCPLISWLNDLKMHSNETDKVEAKLYRSYLVSRRFCFIRNSLGVSDNYLLAKISCFYKKVDYEKLKDFYQFQEAYVKSHSVIDLVHMYPEFVELFKKSASFDDLPLYAREAAFSFGLSMSNKFHDLRDTKDFLFLKQTSEKIYKDTHKAHDINNYRYSQTFHSLNPKLQKIILDYAT